MYFSALLLLFFCYFSWAQLLFFLFVWFFLAFSDSVRRLVQHSASLFWASGPTRRFCPEITRKILILENLLESIPTNVGAQTNRSKIMAKWAAPWFENGSAMLCNMKGPFLPLHRVHLQKERIAMQGKKTPDTGGTWVLQAQTLSNSWQQGAHSCTYALQKYIPFMVLYLCRYTGLVPTFSAIWLKISKMFGVLPGKWKRLIDNQKMHFWCDTWWAFRVSN